MAINFWWTPQLKFLPDLSFGILRLMKQNITLSFLSLSNWSTCVYENHDDEDTRIIMQFVMHSIYGIGTRPFRWGVCSVRAIRLCLSTNDVYTLLTCLYALNQILSPWDLALLGKLWVKKWICNSVGWKFVCVNLTKEKIRIRLMHPHSVIFLPFLSEFS